MLSVFLGTVKQIFKMTKKKAKIAKSWFVYLLECQDGSIYTGIAVDVAARYALHVAGKGARYTRSHPPKCILAVMEYPNRSAASKAEYQLKQLSHKKKCLLIGLSVPAIRK
jgi:putative endonuclease